jgi:hypothetical protein
MNRKNKDKVKDTELCGDCVSLLDDSIFKKFEFLKYWHCMELETKCGKNRKLKNCYEKKEWVEDGRGCCSEKPFPMKHKLCPLNAIQSKEDERKEGKTTCMKCTS